jgi:hypothetical protein
MAEVKDFVYGFILAIVGIIVGANLLGPLLLATAEIPNQYSWIGGIVTLMAAVGLLMFAVKAFGIA